MNFTRAARVFVYEVPDLQDGNTIIVEHGLGEHISFTAWDSSGEVLYPRWATSARDELHMDRVGFHPFATRERIPIAKVVVVG